MIFLLILMPISFNATRVEAAPDVSTEDTGDVCILIFAPGT